MGPPVLRTDSPKVIPSAAIACSRRRAHADQACSIYGRQAILTLQRAVGNTAVSAMLTPTSGASDDRREISTPKLLQRQDPGGTAAGEKGVGIADQPGVPEGWMALPFPMATWNEITRGNQLDQAETDRRRRLLEESAIKVAPNYPWASILLLRWLAGNATEQLLNLPPERLLGEDSGFPTAVRTSVREVLRKGVEARLAEDHPEHFAVGQQALHLRGTGSFEFIGPNQNPRTLSMLQKDLSIALGGVSYTIDADLSLDWTSGSLTTARVTAAQISIVDHYDFNVDDLAMVPLPPGITMPEDIAVAPLPPGITLEDLPIPGEVVQNSLNLNGQEWIVVRDDWLADIAASGGAVNFPVRIEAFGIPAEMFAPIRVAGAAAK